MSVYPLHLDTTSVNVTAPAAKKLRIFNVAMGALHLASGAAMVTLSTRIEGGNPNLSEETADTLTVGLVYEPSFIPGLEASIDYYDIQISDVIASLTNEAILTGCYTDTVGITNDFCAIITRDVDGQLTRILNQEANLNGMRARGVDFALNYRFDLERWQIPGNFRASLIYTRRLELSTEFNSISSVVTVDDVGEVGNAEHEARANLAWSGENWSLRWTTRYIGDVVDSNERVETANAMGWSDPLYLYLDDYWRHDFSASVTPFPEDPSIRIFGSVRNIFNEYGPFLPDGTDNGDAYNFHSSYGVMGRSLTIGLEVAF